MATGPVPTEEEITNAIGVLKAGVAARDAAAAATGDTSALGGLTALLRGAFGGRPMRAAETDEYGSERMAMSRMGMEEDEEKMGGRRSRRAMEEEDQEKMGGRRSRRGGDGSEGEEDSRMAAEDDDDEKKALKARLRKLEASLAYQQGEDMINEMGDARYASGMPADQVRAFAASLYGAPLESITELYQSEAPMINTLKAALAEGDDGDDRVMLSGTSRITGDLRAAAEDAPQEREPLPFNGQLSAASQGRGSGGPTLEDLQKS